MRIWKGVSAHFISKIEQKVKKRKSSYTWSSIPVSHKSVKTCLNTATSVVCLFRKHCILVTDTASAAVGGGGRGTLQQLDWISRGWGGAEGALRLLAPGAGQQVRVDEDYQNTSGQPCPAEGRGGGERGEQGFLAHRPSATGWGGRRTSTSCQITLSCPYDIQRKNAWKENSADAVITVIMWYWTRHLSFWKRVGNVYQNPLSCNLSYLWVNMTWDQDILNELVNGMKTERTLLLCSKYRSFIRFGSQME